MTLKMVSLLTNFAENELFQMFIERHRIYLSDYLP